MHADERFAMGESERFGRTDSDEECPDKTRPLRDRDGVDVLHRHTGFTEGVIDDVGDPFDVVTRGDLGHNPAKPFMTFNLRRDDVR